MKTYAQIDNDGLIYSTVRSKNPVSLIADVEIVEIEGRARVVGKKYDRTKKEIFETDKDGQRSKVTVAGKLAYKKAMTKARITEIRAAAKAELIRKTEEYRALQLAADKGLE
ncbi:MAG: hypothetical protein P8P30_00190 [Rickettsiales bacterium]|nr:hypothetical protein [Rickettsiales bacterium]